VSICQKESIIFSPITAYTNYLHIQHQTELLSKLITLQRLKLYFHSLIPLIKVLPQLQLELLLWEYRLPCRIVFPFLDKSVFTNDNATPIILNNNAPITSNTANIPADSTYFKSTVAPTSTNKNTSAPSHNLLNFADNRKASTLYFCFIMIPTLIIASKPEIGINPANLFCTSKSKQKNTKYYQCFYGISHMILLEE